MFWKKKKKRKKARLNLPPVVLRIEFQRLITMEGHVVVEVPYDVIEGYGGFRKLSESLSDALVKKSCIQWDDDLDSDSASDPLLNSVEWVTGDEWNSRTDSEPTHRCRLTDDGKWQVEELEDFIVEDDDGD